MKKTLLLWGATFFSISIVTGCSSLWYAKRDIRRLHLYNYTYPNELAADCNKWFPVKDSISKKVLPANNFNYSGQIDSLQMIIDSISSIQYPIIRQDSSRLIGQIAFLKTEISKLKSAYKPCKPDTINHFISNTAQLAMLEQKNKIANDSLLIEKTQLTQVKKNRSTWMLIAIGCIAILFTSIVIKFYLFVTKGWARL
ncbi:MAG: hypothetical protein JST50_04735 [Bacteroidetes bacterium]|jgi:hypothetical protein|nr:hypothetical protein [Bacteroidota bacterium]